MDEGQNEGFFNLCPASKFEIKIDRPVSRMELFPVPTGCVWIGHTQPADPVVHFNDDASQSSQPLSISNRRCVIGRRGEPSFLCCRLCVDADPREMSIPYERADHCNFGGCARAQTKPSFCPFVYSSSPLEHTLQVPPNRHASRPISRRQAALAGLTKQP
ncbi:hypothetical protein CEXT_617681 [Caerostris extrusa]|uniref:Uncharacterized protein n=1 Tax=Caerostris extrusa TaxID=172846 RepID=A0AAV4PVW6_CAEEX|nr:hypothetical protein CEXT_617681 [Caerostris extrusa]